MRLFGLDELKQLWAEVGYTVLSVVKIKLGGATLDFVVMAWGYVCPLRPRRRWLPIWRRCLSPLSSVLRVTT